MFSRQAALIDITYTDWFNPREEYKYYMVPGILVLLLTMIGGFITALNIVREKEIGTIEQINVTPIKKWQFILGKADTFLDRGYDCLYRWSGGDVFCVRHFSQRKYCAALSVCGGLPGRTCWDLVC